MSISLPIYYPPAPVNQVLEVNAGWAKKNNITVGDDVHLEKYTSHTKYFYDLESSQNIQTQFIISDRIFS